MCTCARVPRARVHVCTCAIILVLVCGIMYQVPHTDVPGVSSLSAGYQDTYTYIMRMCQGGVRNMCHICTETGVSTFVPGINEIIHRKTEQLCHHRLRSKAHSNEYENNIHKAQEALPAWRGAGRSSRDTKPLLSRSDGARSCRIRLRFPLLF